MAAGMIFVGLENISRWAAEKPRNIWTRSKPSSPRKNPLMNPNLLRTQWHRLPETVIRQLQAEKLRHYLRDVVIPFSAHYREMFSRHGITADSFRTLEDLEQIPFTTKADLANTPEQPQKTRDFLLIPDEKLLARRPSTIFRAIVKGKAAVKRGFESEFRPIFMTSTTGRSADPVPFLFTQFDLDNLQAAGSRL